MKGTAFPPELNKPRPVTQKATRQEHLSAPRRERPPHPNSQVAEFSPRDPVRDCVWTRVFTGDRVIK